MRDFRIPELSRWELRSYGRLRSE